MTFDTLWTNARLATMAEGHAAIGTVENGCIAAKDGRIAYVGPASDLPASTDAAERIDCGGRWITPGLVDCHTHLVYGGHRAHEFAMRLEGASYEEISRAGGGIASSMTSTRAASEAQL
ncbi:MAG: imidazolonepropionase, partial [Pseudorhodoplanes sp.]